MFSINAPPEDNKCEICGRHVSELEPFENGHYQELTVVRSSTMQHITKDNKLAKRYRIYDDCGEASWECRDCFDLQAPGAEDDPEPAELAKGIAYGGMLSIKQLRRFLDNGDDYITALQNLDNFWHAWARGHHVAEYLELESNDLIDYFVLNFY